MHILPFVARSCKYREPDFGMAHWPQTGHAGHEIAPPLFSRGFLPKNRLQITTESHYITRMQASIEMCRQGGTDRRHEWHRGRRPAPWRPIHTGTMISFLPCEVFCLSVPVSRTSSAEPRSRPPPPHCRVDRRPRLGWLSRPVLWRQHATRRKVPHWGWQQRNLSRWSGHMLKL